MKNKTVILDWSIFLFRSAYGSIHNPTIPVTYTALNMIIGNLRRIGISPDDTIIVACDGSKGNWRKKYEPEYKGNRKEQREKSGINFVKIFEDFDWLLQKVDQATNWHVVKLDTIEADDIAAVACRYDKFKDSEIVLVSYDSDWEQMWNFPNVKIFSPMTKRYKIKPEKFDVYKFIAKKIKKETADNLVSPILSVNDFNNREKVINLLELPEFVETPIKESLNNLQEKDIILEELPYDTIRERFMSIYNNGTEPYEKSVKYYERKKKALAKKKALERGAKK